MKHLISIFAAALFVALAPSAFAQSAPTATASVSFTAGSSPAGAVEHFVEMKNGTAWAEVAKGAASPIVWQLASPTPGQQIVARVRARLVSNPAVITDPSNEVVGIVPPLKPSDAKISVTLTVTLTN